MKRYAISIRWRGYRWRLQGVARDSASIVSGLLDYFGSGAYICVRRVFQTQEGWK